MSLSSLHTFLLSLKTSPSSVVFHLFFSLHFFFFPLSRFFSFPSFLLPPTSIRLFSLHIPLAWSGPLEYSLNRLSLCAASALLFSVACRGPSYLSSFTEVFVRGLSHQPSLAAFPMAPPAAGKPACKPPGPLDFSSTLCSSASSDFVDFECACGAKTQVCLAHFTEIVATFFRALSSALSKGKSQNQLYKQVFCSPKGEGVAVAKCALTCVEEGCNSYMLATNPPTFASFTNGCPLPRGHALPTTTKVKPSLHVSPSSANMSAGLGPPVRAEDDPEPEPVEREVSDRAAARLAREEAQRKEEEERIKAELEEKQRLREAEAEAERRKFEAEREMEEQARRERKAQNKAAKAKERAEAKAAAAAAALAPPSTDATSEANGKAKSKSKAAASARRKAGEDHGDSDDDGESLWSARRASKNGDSAAAEGGWAAAAAKPPPPPAPKAVKVPMPQAAAGVPHHAFPLQQQQQQLPQYFQPGYSGFPGSGFQMQPLGRRPILDDAARQDPAALRLDPQYRLKQFQQQYNQQQAQGQQGQQQQSVPTQLTRSMQQPPQEQAPPQLQYQEPAPVSHAQSQPQTRQPVGLPNFLQGQRRAPIAPLASSVSSQVPLPTSAVSSQPLSSHASENVAMPFARYGAPPSAASTSGRPPIGKVPLPSFLQPRSVQPAEAALSLSATPTPPPAGPSWDVPSARWTPTDQDAVSGVEQTPWSTPNTEREAHSPPPTALGFQSYDSLSRQSGSPNMPMSDIMAQLDGDSHGRADVKDGHDDLDFLHQPNIPSSVWEADGMYGADSSGGNSHTSPVDSEAISADSWFGLTSTTGAGQSMWGSALGVTAPSSEAVRTSSALATSTTSSAGPTTSRLDRARQLLREGLNVLYDLKATGASEAEGSHAILATLAAIDLDKMPLSSLLRVLDN